MIVINGVKVTVDTELKYARNPKRVGFKAHARYEAYSECQTLGQYLTLMGHLSLESYSKPDLRYDHDKGHLEFVSIDDKS